MKFPTHLMEQKYSKLLSGDLLPYSSYVCHFFQLPMVFPLLDILTSSSSSCLSVHSAKPKSCSWALPLEPMLLSPYNLWHHLCHPVQYE